MEGAGLGRGRHVEAVGSSVTLFQPAIASATQARSIRPGANAELHLVDERIVGAGPAQPGRCAGRRPAADRDHRLGDCCSTAWRLRAVPGEAPAILLVVGGAGGVGSIAGPAGAPVHGPDRHRHRIPARDGAIGCRDSAPITSSTTARPLAAEVTDAGPRRARRYVFSLTSTEQHMAADRRADRAAGPVRPDRRSRRAHSTSDCSSASAVSLHWELMFTRSLFRTADMQRQHDLLTAVAGLVDQGTLRSTLGQHLGTINAAHLRQAHALLESGRARGKLVLERF